MGLVRGEPKPGAKHRANGGKILREAGEERHSKTNHLDRTLSHLNAYTGFASGDECWDDMEARAGAYRQKVKGKTKTGEEIIREKGLRKDAVIGWAVIIHPADEATRDWTWEEFDRFDCDSMAVLAEICPELFREANVRMTATHKDEVGKHRHRFGDCIAEDGSYCGNRIDAKLLIKINEQFPRMMRERGWPVADMDTTDWERAKKDSAYAAERLAKRESQRLDTNAHVRRAKDEAAQAKLDEAEAVLMDVRSIEAETHDAREQALTEIAEERGLIQAEAMMEAQALRQEAYVDAMCDVADSYIEYEERSRDFQQKEDAFEAQKAVQEAEVAEAKRQFTEAARRYEQAEPTIDDVPAREAIPLLIEGFIDNFSKNANKLAQGFAQFLLEWSKQKNFKGSPLMDVLVEKLTSGKKRPRPSIVDLPQAQRSLDDEMGLG
jgi:flagellar biosynthesis GTPase FlhF